MSTRRGSAEAMYVLMRARGEVSRKSCDDDACAVMTRAHAKEVCKERGKNARCRECCGVREVRRRMR